MTIIFYVGSLLLLDVALRVARIRDMKKLIRRAND